MTPAEIEVMKRFRSMSDADFDKEFANATEADYMQFKDLSARYDKYLAEKQGDADYAQSSLSQMGIGPRPFGQGKGMPAPTADDLRSGNFYGGDVAQQLEDARGVREQPRRTFAGDMGRVWDGIKSFPGYAQRGAQAIADLPMPMDPNTMYLADMQRPTIGETVNAVVKPVQEHVLLPGVEKVVDAGHGIDSYFGIQDDPAYELAVRSMLSGAVGDRAFTNMPEDRRMRAANRFEDEFGAAAPYVQYAMQTVPTLGVGALLPAGPVGRVATNAALGAATSEDPATGMILGAGLGEAAHGAFQLPGAVRAGTQAVREQLSAAADRAANSAQLTGALSPEAGRMVGRQYEPRPATGDETGSRLPYRTSGPMGPAVPRGHYPGARPPPAAPMLPAGSPELPPRDPRAPLFYRQELTPPEQGLDPAAAQHPGASANVLRRQAAEAVRPPSQRALPPGNAIQLPAGEGAEGIPNGALQHPGATPNVLAQVRAAAIERARAQNRPPLTPEQEHAAAVEAAERQGVEPRASTAPASPIFRAPMGSTRTEAPAVPPRGAPPSVESPSAPASRVLIDGDKPGVVVGQRPDGRVEVAVKENGGTVKYTVESERVTPAAPPKAAKPPRFGKAKATEEQAPVEVLPPEGAPLKDGQAVSYGGQNGVIVGRHLDGKLKVAVQENGKTVTYAADPAMVEPPTKLGKGKAKGKAKAEPAQIAAERPAQGPIVVGKSYSIEGNRWLVTGTQADGKYLLRHQPTAEQRAKGAVLGDKAISPATLRSWLDTGAPAVEAAPTQGSIAAPRQAVGMDAKGAPAVGAENGNAPGKETPDTGKRGAQAPSQKESAESVTMPGAAGVAVEPRAKSAKAGFVVRRKGVSPNEAKPNEVKLEGPPGPFGPSPDASSGAAGQPSGKVVVRLQDGTVLPQEHVPYANLSDIVATGEDVVGRRVYYDPTKPGAFARVRGRDKDGNFIIETDGERAILRMAGERLHPVDPPGTAKNVPQMSDAPVPTKAEVDKVVSPERQAAVGNVAKGLSRIQANMGQSRFQKWVRQFLPRHQADDSILSGFLLRAQAAAHMGQSTQEEIRRAFWRAMKPEDRTYFNRASQDVDAYLKGQLPMSEVARRHPEVTAKIQTLVSSIRDEIADLSRRLEVEHRVLPEGLAELREAGEVERYSTSLYRNFFLPPGERFRLMTYADIENAADYIVREHARKGYTITSEHVIGELEAILSTGGDSLEKFRNSGLSRPFTSLKGKVEVPQQLRDLLGEEKSGFLRMAVTLGRQRAILERLNTWKAIAEHGVPFDETSGLTINPYWSKSKRVDLTEHVPDDPRFGIARDGWVRPEFAALVDPATLHAPPGAGAHNWLGAQLKRNMTVLNPGAWVNNVMRNVKNTIMAGGLDPLSWDGSYFHKNFLDGAKLLLKWQDMPLPVGDLALVDEARRFGVIADGFGRTEIAPQAARRIARELQLEMKLNEPQNVWEYAGLAQRVLSRMEKKWNTWGGHGLENLTAFYDMVDQSFKLATYIRLRKQNLALGMPMEEAAMRASVRVNRYFPNFERTAPLVEGMRRQPFGTFTPFLTSQYEDLRANSTFAYDVARGDKAALKAAGSLAIVAGSIYGLGKAAQWASGITPEQADAANKSMKESQSQYRQAVTYLYHDSNGRLQPIDLTSWLPESMLANGNPDDPLATRVGTNMFLQFLQGSPAEAVARTVFENMPGVHLSPMKGQWQRLAEDRGLDALGEVANSNGFAPGAVTRAFKAYREMEHPGRTQEPRTLPQALGYAAGLPMMPGVALRGITEDPTTGQPHTRSPTETGSNLEYARDQKQLGKDAKSAAVQFRDNPEKKKEVQDNVREHLQLNREQRKQRREAIQKALEQAEEQRRLRQAQDSN